VNRKESSSNFHLISNCKFGRVHSSVTSLSSARSPTLSSSPAAHRCSLAAVLCGAAVMRVRASPEGLSAPRLQDFSGPHFSIFFFHRASLPRALSSIVAPSWALWAPPCPNAAGAHSPFATAAAERSLASSICLLSPSPVSSWGAVLAVPSQAVLPHGQKDVESRRRLSFSLRWGLTSFSSACWWAVPAALLLLFFFCDWSRAG
jgi:hypothetical protein